MDDIKAVLFDCDGLMFETEIIAQQIWRDEARKYGVKLPDDFFRKITGAGRAEYKKYTNSIPGLEEVLGRIEEKRFDLSFWKSIHTDCLNKKGLIELFSYLQDHGIQAAVCSSSPRSYVEALIHTVSVPLKYDALVAGDMVKHAKPDPDVFLKAAELLHCAPKNCLVLEDSKQGILAARRAGMHSCFIPDTIQPDAEMKAMIEIQEPDMNAVIALLESRHRTAKA